MFDSNSRSSFVYKWFYLLRTNIYYHLIFKKKLSHIAVKPHVWGIWNIEISGPNIKFNGEVKIFGGNSDKTRLTSVQIGEFEGKISIGNNVLIMNGVRISSASEISIGDNCMLANYCYIMDSDWHDIYDRSKMVGKSEPVVLENNVWIGDSAIICKGVKIGENSVIGAGSVVTCDIPANVIAAGNPARVVEKLDPEKIVKAESSGSVR